MRKKETYYEKNFFKTNSNYNNAVCFFQLWCSTQFFETDEENNQNKTEQKDDKKDPSNTGDEESNGNEGGTETKVPTSLADFVGTVYLVDSYMYYFFKDANTIITCTDWGNDRYGDIEEKEIGKDGTFCDSGLDCKIKVADGKLIMYRSERWEAEKADDIIFKLGSLATIEF